MSGDDPEGYVDPFTGERRAAPPPLPAPRYTVEDIDRALSQVPRFEQRLFVLHRIDGLSYVEIAEQNGISVRRVEKAIARALTLTRRTLMKMGKWD
ncbi:MAG TPA: sigma-70 region 4 domain-containing protein [Acetobacteraceae bacterium]|nr:sigma-70 region 4 domain-containing protein [Acetobacteraceae bacterium]